MSWREKLGEGSFRGKPFHVTSVTYSGGRRGPLEEYPQRDLPYKEDMGRKGRTFPLEAFVIGDDYFAAREALIAALEEPGPGELVHPYYGKRRVAVETFRVSESNDEGGIARFSIEFVETPVKPSQPTAVVDPISKVRASGVAAKASVGAEFLSQYNSSNTLKTSTAGVLESASEAMGSALAKVATGVQTLASVKRQINDFGSNAAALVNSPSVLLSSLLEIFETLGTVVSGIDPIGALLAAYFFTPGTRPPATTTTRAREQANFDAVHRVIQRVIAVHTATVAIELTFPNYEAAVQSRTAITDVLDEQAEVASDDTFPALHQLRADLTKAVPGTSGDLPRLLRVTPGFTVPSLVLAHSLYGNLNFEQDLVDRNNLKHPGFVVGAGELEILSDG